MRTGRLPSIGAEQAPSQPADVVLADPVLLPALTRNARPFANLDAKPLMTVLLLDDPDSPQDLDALGALDFPLTLVIDPTHPAAAERAAQWRKAGQEVAFDAVGLPEGGGPGDFEVALEAFDTSLPQGLAFVGDTAGAFQTDRARAQAASGALAARGYGLVTFERGLNPADQAARKAGVAAAQIFREIDAENESAPAVRRLLDRAVFKAAQDGQVVVLGRLRDETLAGLRDWADSARAAQVAPAPLSATLQKPQP